MKRLKSDLTSSQALDDGALSYTTPAITKPFRLEAITLHADAAISDVVTITRLSGSYVLQSSPVTLAGTAKGSDYDVVMRKVTLTAATDYVFVPTAKRDFQPGEQIKIQCTNVSKAGQTVYVSVKRSELR